MKIAFLSPESVYPVNTGGRVVVYNKIKYLSLLGHKIFLFCIVDTEDEKAIQSTEMEKYCVAAHYYNRNAGTVIKAYNSFLFPFAVGSRFIPELCKDILELTRQESIDLIWCEMPQMAASIMNLDFDKRIKLVLSQQNIEYKAMASLANTFSNPIKRFIYRFDSFRFRLFERRLYRKKIFDSYIFVSDKDMEFFKDDFEYGNKPLKLVPIGAEYRDTISVSNSKNAIIVGKMSYPPNVDGVMWFYNKVWIQIKKRRPEARLFIVGKDPDERIIGIKDSSVTITGTVDSVDPYYRQGAVAIIPLFAGGGVKTKLIEASSYGLPIVCTSAGAAGTKFQNEEHIVITDDPKVFEESVVTALDHDDSVIQRARRAHDLFENEYTWEGIVKDLDVFLQNLVGSGFNSSMRSK